MGTDFDLTNISTLTSITQTSPTVCTIAANSDALVGGIAVESTLTKAASFSITYTAGNAQTTLVGSPQSVTVTRMAQPSAPVISSVTAGNAQVVVAWVTPATNGAAISDYVVQYSTSSGGSYATFDDGTSTSTSATVTGLTNYTPYYFKVAAINSVGTGSYSNESTVLPVPTGAPTVVAGTAGNTTVALTWVAPASTGGSDITDFVVQYSTSSSDSYTTFDDGTSTSTSATVTGLTNGIAYYFKVFATHSAGTLPDSAASAAIRPSDCAIVGGTCIVGDTGPGGGVVFYVQASGGTFSCGATLASICKYLEAAPANWLTGTTGDPTRTWATDTDPGLGRGNQEALVSGADGIAIGTGYQNSLDIVAQTGNVAATSAAVEARAYQGNSKTDWHLPSRDELNQMCKWQRGVAWTSDANVCTGGILNSGPGASGFSGLLYWVSSEYTAIGAWFQNFNLGTPSNTTKYTTLQIRVRPVRAFG